MTYNSTENSKCYFPPLLSNGNISFAPDAEGMLGYTIDDYQRKGLRGFDGIVVRSARRCAPGYQMQARLFPFGKFTFVEGTELKEWSQSLEPEKGFFESDCLYADGAKIHSRGFIHPELNVYALQKNFGNVGGKKSFAYDVNLCGYDEKIEKYMDVLYTERRGDVCSIGFKMYGMEVFRGEIHVFVNRDFTMIPLEKGVRILFEAADGEEVSFFYYLEDDLNGVDFEQVLKELKKKIDETGFSGLLEECEKHYAAFYSLGYVNTSDEKLNSIYKTALYGVKCSTTQYSIAVCFNNGGWDGRFFAFDEYTSYLGLLGANRLALAKRVPLYRLHSCLDAAIRRASDSHRNADTEDMARFHWECGEIDRIELAPSGHWLDHIFHIPLIGMGAFEFFEYSEDKAFLEECYKMIRACAKFITKHMVYKDGDRYYIGKCTDMERLGSSVQNPFLTACGAVRLLQCCAKAANILEIDEAYAAECDFIADRLFENLPAEDNRYVPFLNCKQKSIAVFGGKFPFQVLNDDDERMINAWEDFEENGAAYGNMYPTGNGISPWYAGWKAIAYARAKMPDKAYDALQQAYRSVGVFDEMFEINEPTVRFNPWFTTAAGIYVAAVNEMLLQSDGKVIRIMPGIPHDLDVSFKLAAKGGVTVEAEAKSGELTKVLVQKGGCDVTDQFTILF